MRRDYLILKLKRLGLNFETAKLIVDLFFDSIIESLEQGKPARLVGFGKFSIKKRKAKKFTNPKTGDVIEIKERHTVKFTPSRQWKELLK